MWCKWYDAACHARRVVKVVTEVAETGVDIVEGGVEVAEKVTNGAVDLVQEGVREAQEAIEAVDELVEDVPVVREVTGAAAGLTGEVVDTAQGAVDGIQEGTGAALDGGVSVLRGGVSVVEVTGGAATLDLESVQTGLDKLEEHLQDAVEHNVNAAGGQVAIVTDVLIGLPVTAAAVVVDEAFGGDLAVETRSVRSNVRREVRRGTKQVGAVLRVATEPENLGKIAVIYVATSFAGPAGAALANVLYDKYVLDKSMTEEDMVESFAIGLAGGYAAQQVAGLEALRDSAYAAQASSEVARNLATDAGSVLLRNEDYNSEDFFVSLASGLATADLGSGSVQQVAESTLNAGLRTTATQAIRNDLAIDFASVEQAVYQGFAYGLTREGIHAVVDEVGITTRAADAGEKFADMLYEVLAASEDEQVATFVSSLQESSSAEKERVLNAVNELGAELRERIARVHYGKAFGDLTPAEATADAFETALDVARSDATSNPIWLRPDGETIPEAAVPVLTVLASHGNYANVEDLITDLERVGGVAENEGGALAEFAVDLGRTERLSVHPYVEDLSQPASTETGASSNRRWDATFELKALRLPKEQVDSARRQVLESPDAQVGLEYGEVVETEETRVSVIGEDGEVLRSVAVPGHIDALEASGPEAVYAQLREKVSDPAFWPAPGEPLRVAVEVQQRVQVMVPADVFTELGVGISSYSYPIGVAELRVSYTDPGRAEGAAEDGDALPHRGRDAPYHVDDGGRLSAPSLPPDFFETMPDRNPERVPDQNGELQRRIDVLRDRLEGADASSVETILGREVGARALELAEEELEHGNFNEAEYLYDLALLMADVALGVAPYTGTFKDAYEFLVGLGLLTQERLTDLERAFAALGLAAGLGTAGVVNSEYVEMGVRLLVRVAERVDYSLLYVFMGHGGRQFGEIGRLANETAASLRGASRQAKAFVAQVAQRRTLDDVSILRIVTNYDDLAVKFSRYVDEVGQPVAEHRTVRIVRATGEDGGPISADQAQGIHELMTTNSHRYTESGDFGYYAVRLEDAGSADAARQVATAAARAEIGIGATERYHVVERVVIGRTLDLTDDGVRAGLEINRARLMIEDYEYTQQLGNVAKNLGYDVIVFPSAAADGASSVVVLRAELLQ